MSPIAVPDGPVLDASTARRHGREARSALEGTDRARSSAALAETLLTLPELADATAIGGYWPTAAEVDLRYVWSQLHERGVQVHLPRIDAGPSEHGARMEFVRWTPEVEMRPNRFAVPEPVGDSAPVADLDVLVVPCVAVDRHGTRVGMGAGYYDRTLAEVHPRPALVGAAFECQVFERIEARSWDIAMDLVATEARVTRIPDPQN